MPMSKTIVIPVGEPEHMLEVVLTDNELVRIVLDTMTARWGAIVPANPGASPVSLSRGYSGMERDFHLAMAVARLMALTGRNLRDPDAGVPFGHVRGGQPRANTMTTNRDSSRPIPGRSSLLSFLEDEEPDTDERYITHTAEFIQYSAAAEMEAAAVSAQEALRPRTVRERFDWTRVFTDPPPALQEADRERDLRTADEITRDARQLLRSLRTADEITRLARPPPSLARQPRRNLREPGNNALFIGPGDESFE